MNYEQFCFTRLFLARYKGHALNDRLYEIIKTERAEFLCSPFNRENEDLSTCIKSYLDRDRLQDFCRRHSSIFNMYELLEDFNWKGYTCATKLNHDARDHAETKGYFYNAYQWDTPESIDYLNENGRWVKACELFRETDIHSSHTTPIELAKLVRVEEFEQSFNNIDFSSLINDL